VAADTFFPLLTRHHSAFVAPLSAINWIEDIFVVAGLSFVVYGLAQLF
jgi:hypothetical protein